LILLCAPADIKMNRKMKKVNGLIIAG